jgi:hypothetical protein
MPPTAILIVIKINDPMPGVLLPELSGKAVKLAAVSDKNSWQIALRSQLSDFYQTANRPSSSGALAGEQNAVLFKDQAELLACFCRDLIVGGVSEKWWWRSHFGQSLQTMMPGVMIYKVLVEAPRLVPAVISLLAEWHYAIKLVKTIDASAVQHITQIMLYEYGLAELDEKLRNSVLLNDSLNIIEDDQFDSTDSYMGDQYTGNEFGTHYCVPPPWLNFFDRECWEPDLSKEQSGLIGIARLLQSSPMTLRGENFQKQVVNWWSTIGQRELQHQELDFQTIKQKRIAAARSRDKSDINGHDSPSISFNDSNSMAQEVQGEVENSAESFNTFEQDVHQSINEHALEQSSHSDASLPDNDFDIHYEQESFNSFEHNAHQDLNGQALEQSSQSDTSPQKNNVDIYHSQEKFQESEPATFEESTILRNQGDKAIYSFEQEEMPEPHLDSELEDSLEAEDEFDDVDFNFSDTYFDTQLGGILYLINLLNQLDLPACMGESWKFDQQLSRWALVDIITRALLAKDFKEIDKDPIWRMLEKLDRRRTKKDIGKGFQAQSDYSMPLDWYQYFTDKALPQAQQFYWASHNRRLRIWADYGVIIDCKVTDIDFNESLVLKELHKYAPDINPQWLHRGLYRQAPMANQSQLFRAGINQDIGHWLALVLPPIRAYLQDILSVSSTTTQALLTNLFQCEGRIYVSSSHIDLVASVNSTKLSLRCCGLDQDPGWLPEYGRVVLFHYTQA